MWTLQEEFSDVEIGQFSQFRNLTLFPLVRRSAPARQLDYLLLEDGIAQGKVRVSELHAGGSVSELRLENNAELPVLLVDGEELIGAKQNRVLNLTILAPAKQTTVIPVSCVEAGRWSMSSADLKTSDDMMYSFGRWEQLAHVTESMRSNGTRKSNQGAIWRNIAAKAMRLKAAAPTGAMSAIFESHASCLEEFASAFTWQESQCALRSPSAAEFWDWRSSIARRSCAGSSKNSCEATPWMPWMRTRQQTNPQVSKRWARL